VAFAATGVESDLYFIKTRNTGSGKVEVHSYPRSSAYQGGGIHTATALGTGDQSNGWFQMVGTDLYFIKTKNTGSGKVEIHSYPRSSNYQGGGIHTATALGTGDQSNGWFQMVGTDLYFIKTKNTGSGKVEVHSYPRSSNYQGGGIHTATALGTGDQSNGYFQMSSLIDVFRAWALNPQNWNSVTPSNNRGIDADGSFGAQCADLGIAWSQQAGARVGFDGWDTSSASKPGWHYVSGNLSQVQPGDVVTRVGGIQHVVVVVGPPSGGSVEVLQQNPGSPAVAGYSTGTTGVIWRLN